MHRSTSSLAFSQTFTEALAYAYLSKQSGKSKNIVLLFWRKTTSCNIQNIRPKFSKGLFAFWDALSLYINSLTMLVLGSHVLHKKIIFVSAVTFISFEHENYVLVLMVWFMENCREICKIVNWYQQHIKWRTTSQLDMCQSKSGISTFKMINTAMLWIWWRLYKPPGPQPWQVSIKEAKRESPS